MALYLLDKNIIVDIHHSLRGRGSEAIAEARRVDIARNTVSPLLAILEGSVQRAQTVEEAVTQLEMDARAVGRFYRYATTDSKYLQEVAVDMAEVLGAHWLQKTSYLVPLCQSLQEILARTYSVIDARSVLDGLVSKCEEAGVPLSHPLATCAVACLYGNKSARKVIKPSAEPTREGAYNAVSDIRMIMESAYIRKLWQTGAKQEPVHLLSRDIHLNEFAKMVSVRVELATSDPHADQESVTYRVSVGGELFPSIASNDREIARVMELYRSLDAAT